MRRRHYALVLLVAGMAAALMSPGLLAQRPGSFNEYEAQPKVHVLDKGDIWVLKFRFNAPRLITVDIPGRGRKLCWYLLYHVTNPDLKEPHTFVPDFELVTHDTPGVSHDQVLPTVQKAIQQIEDPTGHLDIKNSVTMENQPLLPAKPDSLPRWTTGVAIWDDVNPETNRFSIFVAGLSNGYSVDDKDIIRRKTLQLNFQRLGDRTNRDARDIHFVPPEAWIYRASTLKAPQPSKAPEAKPTAPPAPGLNPPTIEMTSPSTR
jgi:hypothetical protein